MHRLRTTSAPYLVSKLNKEIYMKDSVLITWIVCAFLFDVFLLVGTSYLVFGRGASGWWFLLAIAIGMSPTLFKVLRKRYQVEED